LRLTTLILLVATFVTVAAAQKQQANQLNEKAITYNQLKHDADSNRQLYDELQQKLKEAGITQ